MTLFTYWAFVAPAAVAITGLGIYGIAVYFDRPSTRPN